MSTSANLDPVDAALSRHTSALYEAEHAASQYALLVIEKTIRDFLAYLKEEADSINEAEEHVHGFVDGLPAVIYTHRASALVAGSMGHEEAFARYQEHHGLYLDEIPPVESLAYYILASELYEVARDLEEGGAA